MRAIVPVAGIGTRLRPHTHTAPKVLLHVAGKPLLGPTTTDEASTTYEQRYRLAARAKRLQKKRRRGIISVVNSTSICSESGSKLCMQRST